MGYVILMLISAAGFLASASCQVLSWHGKDPPGGPAVFLLHFGVFAVWIPLVNLSNRTMPKGAGNNVDRLLAAALPAWVTKAYKVLSFLTALGFVYVIFWFLGQAKHQHQSPLLLEAPKQNLVPPMVLRWISTVWMAFYGFATIGFAGLARLARKQKQELSIDSPP